MSTITSPGPPKRPPAFGTLRPQGRLAIIDFQPSWWLSLFFPVHGAPSSRGGHGVPPSIVMTEMKQAGFELIDRIDDWPGGRYCLIFQKSQSESSELP
jgi:hypothetical protein